MYFDIEGWYAFGHHDPKTFLEAVVKQRPDADLSMAQVQLGWANFDGNNFEITDVPNRGSQPITMIENWE